MDVMIVAGFRLTVKIREHAGLEAVLRAWKDNTPLTLTLAVNET